MTDTADYHHSGGTGEPTLQMQRSPMPSDHETVPRNAAEIMLALHEQIGLPLADLVHLDLQAVHDLFSAHLAPEDAEDGERLVIVDDDTLPALDRAVTAKLARARPDRRIEEEGYEGWISRSRAVERLGGMADATLPELDAALAAAGGKDDIVLEDGDYRQVMAALNQALSSRPHGRSAVISGATRKEALAAARAATRARGLPNREDDDESMETSVLADADTGGMLFRHDPETHTLWFVGPDGSGGEAELLELEATGREGFLAAAVWLGERRHLWSDWREVAELLGGDQLRDHLSRLHGGGSLEAILATLVANGAEDDPQIRIVAVLPARMLVILEHRFASNAHREAFFRWVEQDEPHATLEALSLLGLLEGPGMLAAHIVAVAAVPVHTGTDTSQ